MHQSTPDAFEKDGVYYKEVQDIRAKDKVLALNEKTGQERYSVVKQTFIRQADKIYELTYEDGTLIETTWSHPFYIRGKGWVKAEDLVEGDVSQTEGNGSLKITKIHVDVRGEQVYNFEVEEDHNYYVSEAGVLVHNEANYTPSSEYTDLIALMLKDSTHSETIVVDEVKSFLTSAFGVLSPAAALLTTHIGAKEQREKVARFKEAGGERTLKLEIAKELEHDTRLALVELKTQEQVLTENERAELAALDKARQNNEIKPETYRELKELVLIRVANAKNAIKIQRELYSPVQDRLQKALNTPDMSLQSLENTILNAGERIYGQRYRTAVQNEMRSARELTEEFKTSANIDGFQVMAGVNAKDVVTSSVVQSADFYSIFRIGKKLTAYGNAVQQRRWWAKNYSIRNRLDANWRYIETVTPRTHENEKDQEAVRMLVAE